MWYRAAIVHVERQICATLSETARKIPSWTRTTGSISDHYFPLELGGKAGSFFCCSGGVRGQISSLLNFLLIYHQTPVSR